MQNLKRTTIIIVILSIIGCIPIDRIWARNLQATEEWQIVGPGFQYQKFHLNSPRPIDIFVVRMDRSNPASAIDTAIAQGRLSGGVETVRDMAGRYDQSIGYWGEQWGTRNQIVAAVNGYFFGAPQEPSGVPWSGQIHSGWYAKRYSETVGDAGFVWTLGGQADIGSCVFHRSARNYLKFKRANYTRGINSINVARVDEAVIMYTPQFDSSTLTVSPSGNHVLEIQIEVSRPTLIIPSPREVVGVIRDIRDRTGATKIPFDHVVISAWGEARTTILSRIQNDEIGVGDDVGITQEIQNCLDSPQVDWTKAYAGIGGDYHFLNDGVVRTDFGNPDATVPNSRTAVAYNQDYVFFVVVDGWNRGVSEGITIPGLGNFIKNTLSGTDAVSLDSGGSSTMVVNSQVVNNTYCNFTRDCGMRALDDEANLKDLPRSRITANEDLEPLVGNGLMMVAVLPKLQSTNYAIGQEITTSSTANIRLGPGNYFSSITSIPNGSGGVVIQHNAGLQGIYSKGFYWWKVNINGNVGWMKQDDLIGGALPFSHFARFPLLLKSKLGGD